MITVNTLHQLSKKEVSILQQLIGQTLVAINCSGVDLSAQHDYYDFTNTINLKFQELPGFVCINAHFDETSFGDDFNTISLETSKNPVGINRHKSGALEHPFVNLSVSPTFIVRKIEVYGRSYVCQSENTDTSPVWGIEQNNPGKAITENIESENTLVFYSDNLRLFIKSYGPIPWITVSFDTQYIDQLLIEKNIAGETITKLKHTISTQPLVSTVKSGVSPIEIKYNKPRISAFGRLIKKLF